MIDSSHWKKPTSIDISYKNIEDGKIEIKIQFSDDDNKKWGLSFWEERVELDSLYALFSENLCFKENVEKDITVEKISERIIREFPKNRRASILEESYTVNPQNEHRASSKE